jgi:hypothetical protein
MLKMDLQQWDASRFQETVKLYRHYDQEFWQIPAAVVVVDSFLLSVRNSSILPGIDAGLIVLLAILFNVVFTLRQFRITQRLRILAKLLVDLEKFVELDKARAENYSKFAQLLKVQVGYWVTVLLASFTAYLIFVLIQTLL